jgi:hypothetical protein
MRLAPERARGQSTGASAQTACLSEMRRFETGPRHPQSGNGPVTHQSAHHDKFAHLVGCRDGVMVGECHQDCCRLVC